MRIEIGINPNCSELTVRFRTDKLTKKEEEKLFNALEVFVKEYNYETAVSRDTIFGIKCITVDGDAPYNNSDGMIAATKNFNFMNKVKIESEER